MLIIYFELFNGYRWLMKQLPKCQLRVKPKGTTKSDEFVCSGGVNFYSLGNDAELCQHCTILESSLSILLHCHHSDVSTILNTVSGQKVLLHEVDCFAKPSDEKCNRCPNLNSAIADV
jgi:hypothetical protein